MHQNFISIMHFLKLTFYSLFIQVGKESKERENKFDQKSFSFC